MASVAQSSERAPTAKLTPNLTNLPPALRAQLAQRWTAAALAEHASIASFHRVALELLAHGAPMELLARAQRAALQELDHTRRCLQLASAYAGHAVLPGPMPLGDAAPLAPDLVALAVATARDGAIVETLSAWVAAAVRDRATDPAVHSAMRAIARDEATHAELAWATLRWALDAGGAPVHAALTEVFAALRPVSIPPQDTDPRLQAHGMLSTAQRHQAENEALLRLVLPAAAMLLAGSTARETAVPA